MTRKIFLNVPYEEKDQVKRLGARWDVEDRGWYIPEKLQRAAFEQWLPRMFQANAKPPHILSELIPSPSWYINLRSLLPADDWTSLRHQCSDKAGRRCQVCGGRGPRWPVECNEQWQYFENPATPGCGVQKLLRLVALCPTCHSTKHLGKAQIDGTYEAALAQLGYVNSWTAEQCEVHANQAFHVWERRSAMFWQFDLSILQSWNISELNIQAYGFSPLPSIEGVNVVVHPTLAMQFNHDAGLVPLDELLWPYRCGVLFPNMPLAAGIWPGTDPLDDD